jgi:hypothetical protein
VNMIMKGCSKELNPYIYPFSLFLRKSSFNFGVIMTLCSLLLLYFKW